MRQNCGLRSGLGIFRFAEDPQQGVLPERPKGASWQPGSFPRLRRAQGNHCHLACNARSPEAYYRLRRAPGNHCHLACNARSPEAAPAFGVHQAITVIWRVTPAARKLPPPAACTRLPS